MSTPNNIKHISDAASSVDFENKGNFPETVKNVQEALDKIGSWSITDNGLPYATIATDGVVKLAVLEDIEKGTDEYKVPTARAVHEYVKKPQATEEVPGTIEIATDSEVKAGVDLERAVTPKTLSNLLDYRIATETKAGTAMVATVDQAKIASADNLIMTPAKVKVAIDTHVKPVASATESTLGIVRLATTEEVRAGTLQNGIAISPFQFSRAFGTESSFGTFKAANRSDIISGVAIDKAVTPKSLFDTKGTPSNFGIVKLSATHSATPNTALASTANVLYKTGGVMSGDIFVGSQTEANRLAKMSDMYSNMPVGSIIMWLSPTMPSGNWAMLNGMWLNKSVYSELYRFIGDQFGSRGNEFAIPDWRGCFIRMMDIGRNLDPGRHISHLQEDQVQRHKHASAFSEAWDMGAIFGKSNHRNHVGASGGRDRDNYLYWTNDGSDYDGVVNPSGVIGNETRPKNMACYYIIKIR